MKRTSTFFCSAAAPAVLAGFIITSCGGTHGEDDWRLGESRSTVASSDNLLAEMAAAAAAGEFRIRVPLGVDRSAIALGAAGTLTLGRGSRVSALRRVRHCQRRRRRRSG